MATDSAPENEEAHREAVEGFSDWTEDDAFAASDADDPGPVTRGGSHGTFLTDLDETLRSAGLTVIVQDGWQKRSRSSGNYTRDPVGIIVHHTGGGKGADGQGDVNFILTKPGAAPVSNLYLDRRGQWWVIAAGATNTNGKGGPWGPIPKDDANRRVIGIEAGNLGNGEPWPNEMQDSYVTGVAALADRYGIDTGNVLSHFEWRRTAPNADQKVDPAGPSRFGSINGAGTWDMNTFRAEVNDVRTHRSTIEVVQPKISGEDMYVIQQGDSWWSIAEKTVGNARATWESLADANGGKDRVLMVGQVLTIPGAKQSAGGSTTTATTPTFPGEAKLGMKGPIVLAWQEALIARGAIADNEDNRDADYAGGMKKAVLELQQSWGWSDADGVAGSGTWRKLHSQT